MGGVGTPQTRRVGTASSSRLSRRYAARKITIRTFATSPSWIVWPPPISIQSRAPLMRVPKIMVISSRPTPVRPIR